MKKVYTFLGVLLLFLFSFSSLLRSEEKTETFEKNLLIDSSQPVSLEFNDVDGNLDFTSWEENLVRIRVKKKIKMRDNQKAERLLQETEVKVSQKGNSIRVEIRYPEVEGIFFWLKDYERVKVSTEIMLPLNSNIVCNLSDGSIYGEKASGQMTLKTEDGSIRLNDIDGSVKASTEDGKIILINIEGAVKGKSEDGDIFLSGKIKKLDLFTEDGDITVKLAPQSLMDEDWKISTEDGDIDSFLPSNFSADFLIHTEDGDIDCQVPVAFTSPASKRKLSGKINQGGHLLTIRTEDGDISVRNLSSFD